MRRTASSSRLPRHEPDGRRPPFGAPRIRAAITWRGPRPVPAHRQGRRQLGEEAPPEAPCGGRAAERRRRIRRGGIVRHWSSTWPGTREPSVPPRTGTSSPSPSDSHVRMSPTTCRRRRRRPVKRRLGTMTEVFWLAEGRGGTPGRYDNTATMRTNETSVQPDVHKEFTSC
jgi:hypothetical protein